MCQPIRRHAHTDTHQYARAFSQIHTRGLIASGTAARAHLSHIAALWGRLTAAPASCASSGISSRTPSFRTPLSARTNQLHSNSTIMNSDEVYEIKKTWEIPAATPMESGIAILTTFFTKYPSNLEKFYAFKDIPLAELSTNARFKAHATRIIKVFDDSIQMLGHDWAGPKLEEMWSKLAESHFNRHIEKQSFTDLKVAIMEVLGAACNLNEKQAQAWSKLIDIVYSIVFSHMDKLQDGGQ